MQQPAGGRVLAVLRIAMGLVFGWAFLDKLIGLDYATRVGNTWVYGGHPTMGFLNGRGHGPFRPTFRPWAGQGWADWLFLLGLAGVAAALLLGVAVRVAAAAGSLMMLLMWAVQRPLGSPADAGALAGPTTPLINYHVIYALVLVVLAVAGAGSVWGLGERWARLDVVRRNTWLR